MEDNIFSGFNVQEEGDFSQGVPSLKEIALMHIRKISQICCAEFSKGYWEEKPLKVGGGIAMTRTYHPDMRAVFCNAVDFLVWIVYPTSDSDFKAKAEGITEDEKDLDKKLAERKKIFREVNLMFERTNFFDSQAGKTERGR